MNCWGCKKPLTTFTYVEIITEGKRKSYPVCDSCRTELHDIKEGKRK